MVSTAYGISWMYLIGDVAYESWKARLYQQGLYKPGLQPWHKLPSDISEEERAQISASAPDWRLVTVKRGLFQAIASMGLPAFTIHTAVKTATTYFDKSNIKNVKLKTYGPVGLGLAIVPALPYLFDEPVEHALDYVFDKGEDLYKSYR